MKEPQRTSIPFIVLVGLLVLIPGCPDSTRFADVPDYSAMSDGGEVHADGQHAVLSKSTPPSEMVSGQNSFVIHWYYVVPVLALGLLGAAFVIRKKSTPSQSGTTEDNNLPAETGNQSDTELPSDSDTPSDTFSQVDSGFEVDRDDSETEMDSAVLLDDDESDIGSMTGSMLKEQDHKLDQLKKANDSARKNLELALTKIGKLKSKLREKIALIARLESVSQEFDDADVKNWSPDQLRERLKTLTNEHQTAIEKLDYTSDRNRKLKAKLREKVELIEVLKGVSREFDADEIEDVSPIEWKSRIAAIQKDRANLKAETAHLREKNTQLKNKLREKLELIENLKSKTDSGLQRDDEQGHAPNANLGIHSR